MTALRGTEEDRFIPPGTFVRLSVQVNERDTLEPDFGFVIRCWKDASRGRFACLVAFLGADCPSSDSKDPYYSTVAATTLAEQAGGDTQRPA